MTGCQGSCNQGRTSCDCMRWNGTSRETQPGDLLPVSPDPAVGRNGRWYAVLAVIACAVLANVLAQVMR